ncbi:hypothetical protein [Hymenobacter rubidus]|uniref:hypothetical protein n=1 Tax=Hymenobacter rubidus TaxID=1441626 RepID=UPI00191C9276|nr:hypothetical protein [Hymenobacter rubidus]
MLYRLGALLALGLLAAPAHAQLITDPARATAARDTLLHQAALLRERAVQTSAFFTTNVRGDNRRRVVVQGKSAFKSAPPAPTSVRQAQWAPDNIAWRHITRYRRNGRVQERFRITMDGKTLLKEHRLNGAVQWLYIPVAYSSAIGLAVHHRGFYLLTGYVLLDKEQYALPKPMQ